MTRVQPVCQTADLEPPKFERSRGMDTPFVKAQHYFGQAEKMRELAAAEEDAASRTAYYK